MDTANRFHLIPAGELRCVWMTAGVLAYRLCDRTLDCDDCPLDAAITRRFPSRIPGLDEEHAIPASTTLQQIPEEGYRYSRNHLWGCYIDDGRVRFGIEAGLSQALLTVKAIVFPSPEQHVLRGQSFVWLVMDGGTLPLEAPLDGIVRRINHDLVAKPHMLCLDPFGGGWLCELDLDTPDEVTKDLYAADDARPKFAADRKRFLASLNRAMRGKRRAAGPAQADGGEMLQNLCEVLGPSRYFAIVREAYGWSRR